MRGQWAYAGERGRASPGWVEGSTGWRAVGCSTRNFSQTWTSRVQVAIKTDFRANVFWGGRDIFAPHERCRPHFSATLDHPALLFSQNKSDSYAILATSVRGHRRRPRPRRMRRREWMSRSACARRGWRDSVRELCRVRTLPCRHLPSGQCYSGAGRVTGDHNLKVQTAPTKTRSRLVI